MAQLLENAARPAVVSRSPITRPRLLAALIIAGVSDALSVWIQFVLPVQLLIDASTAVLLFIVLGWQPLLLPALIAEAIPGAATIPSWLLVVSAIVVKEERGRPR